MASKNSSIEIEVPSTEIVNMVVVTPDKWCLTYKVQSSIGTMAVFRQVIRIKGIKRFESPGWDGSFRVVVVRNLFCHDDL